VTDVHDVPTAPTTSPVPGPPAEVAPVPTAPAPLWLPADEQLVRRHTAGRPPDHVTGWTAPARVVRWLTPRSWWHRLRRWGLVVAIVLLVASLPRLAAEGGWADLLRVAGYHWYALAWLLVVSVTLRAVRLQRVLAAWLFGFAGAAVLVHLLWSPLAELLSVDEDGVNVWLVPPLEELVKLLPVALVVGLGARRLAQPGMVDTLILGYAVGAGYNFHEDALWGRSTSSGFEAPWGLLFPSFFQPGGDVLIVGHAAWTALAALGLGLLVLHRRRPVLAVIGAVLVVVPILDHMAANDRGERLGWVLDLLYDHRVPAVLLVAGVASAILLDRSSLRWARRRDHLFGPVSLAEPAGDDLPPTTAMRRTLAASRYVRWRNGAHYAFQRRTGTWPAPRPDRTAAAVRALARSGRAAGALGPGRRPLGGWRPDPRRADRWRYLSVDGWTPYVVDGDRPGVDRSGSPLAPEADRGVGPGWWRGAGLTAAAVGALVAVRLLTVPEDTGGGVQFGPPAPGSGWPEPLARPAGWWAGILASLPAAPNSPPVWPSLTGGAGAGPGMGPGGPGGDGPGGDPPPVPDDELPDFDDPPPPPPEDGPPPDDEPGDDDEQDDEDEEDCER
jgi:RsiW-degrading membrane proteinase PrsW (M82 family)